ncbi:MAG TPA: hypothetical protein V6D17_03035 [Candidatus Obscuribacterales bacterium]
MPLFESFSQSVRLPRLNSYPGTEDLKYALAEARKCKGKVLELPFEDPYSRMPFIVKLTLSAGNSPPSWTLQAGEGAEARVVWTRISADVLMIQSKIKLDSQRMADNTRQQEQPPEVAQEERTPILAQPSSSSQPIILGSPSTMNAASQPIILGSPSSMNAAPQPIALGSPSTMNAPSQPIALGSPSTMNTGGLDSPNFATPPKSLDSSPAPPTLAAFFTQPYPEPLNSFLGTSPETPAGGVVDSKTMPSPPSEIAAKSASDAQRTSAQESAMPERPLPPPIKLDRSLVNHVHGQLQDQASGMMTFPAFVFFLYREFLRFQKDKTPFSVIVFEIALMRGGSICAPAPNAVQQVTGGVRSLCHPLDVCAQLSDREFGVLLCSTSVSAALDFAISLHEAVTGSLGPEDGSVLAAIGIANMPHTCNHPEVLLAAANEAKELAKSSPKPYLLFPHRQA